MVYQKAYNDKMNHNMVWGLEAVPNDVWSLISTKCLTGTVLCFLDMWVDTIWTQMKEKPLNVKNAWEKFRTV